MNKGLLLPYLVLLFSLTGTAWGVKQHPLLPAYPDSRVRKELVIDYEIFRLPTGLITNNADKNSFPFLTVVGDISHYFYIVDNVSTTKIYQNYLKALKGSGFELIFQCELEACGDYTSRTALGGALSNEGQVYNYHRKPYALIASGKGSKGKIYVGLFIGGYEDESAIQQVIIEEERLDTGLIKLEKRYLQSQPQGTLMPKANPRDLDKDHPLFSRYPGARIYNHQKVDYEKITVPYSIKGVGTPDYLVETRELTGDITRHFYVIDNVSSLKIFRNYREALLTAGFNIRFECELAQCGNDKRATRLGAMISLNGSVFNYHHKPYFIVGEMQGPAGLVYAGFFIASYEDEAAVQQIIVETEPEETGLIKVDADSLKKDLEQKGKASIYGIFFDIDKATIKPESKPALDEIAKLLKNNPELKLYVVGHTDDTGTLDHNIQLSSRRAQAVRDALVQNYGIADERLISRGVGPFAPESNNTSNRGKQLNRRVELVKRLQ